ncbi:hypothetical protein ABZ208_25540 [Streptomyces sp. NPDC006208]|uniref:hypothetical protein n=1 Tax=Streptomyces sp. NPDC006208 TaxID=3156734 RepID=UPI0033AA4C8F
MTPIAAEVLHELAASAPASMGTVLDSTTSLLTPGWLPGRVVAAIARQSAEILAAEVRVPLPGA